MIFAGGKILPDTELNPVLGCLEEETAQTLSGPPLETETVLNALDALVRELDSGALDPLIAQFAPPGAREELDRVRPQIGRAALEARLELELGGLSGPRPFGRSEVRPLGVLLHAAPGNMAGLPVFTAVEGLLTGNVNLVKLPHGDKGLSLAIFQKLTKLEPKLAPWLYAFDLSSKSSGAIQALAALADGIVTWGGDGAISAMRSMAPPGCRLIEWGHRLSFAYLSRSSCLRRSGFASNFSRSWKRPPRNTIKPPARRRRGPSTPGRRRWNRLWTAPVPGTWSFPDSAAL